MKKHNIRTKKWGENFSQIPEEIVTISEGYNLQNYEYRLFTNDSSDIYLMYFRTQKMFRIVTNNPDQFISYAELIRNWRPITE